MKNLPPVTKFIILINIFIFFLQMTLPFVAETFPLYPYGSEKFLYTQYLTACFSHGGLIHLFLNMYIFYGFGQTLEQRFGSNRFLLFYLTVGVLSNISWHLLQDITIPGLGASGALYGVLSLFVILYPDRKLSIIFIPYGFKAKYLFGTIILIELILSIMGIQDGIGHIVHLSGAMIGTIYYILFLKRRRSGKFGC